MFKVLVQKSKTDNKNERCPKPQEAGTFPERSLGQLLTKAVSLSAWGGGSADVLLPAGAFLAWLRGSTYHLDHVEEATGGLPRAGSCHGPSMLAQPTCWPGSLEASPGPGILVYGLLRSWQRVWNHLFGSPGTRGPVLLPPTCAGGLRQGG